jgi:hypothetical protein
MRMPPCSSPPFAGAHVGRCAVVIAAVWHKLLQERLLRRRQCARGVLATAAAAAATDDDDYDDDAAAPAASQNVEEAPQRINCMITL